MLTLNRLITPKKLNPRIIRSLSVTSSLGLEKPSLTFFTKKTCMLCTNAHQVLNDTLHNESLKHKDIDLKIIDIMNPENQKWFDVYCYDVPVLHVDRESQKKPVKFMHYLYEDKLLEEFNKE
ncbi:hypothetical protein DFJ63DRAFT_336465 [Scheffersomyces coipomensis]|uniref:uncharacterized protein n=1 Tax=Scheffersomyces coipomensis TaxID=1788519 RepID=UPI00315C6254